MTEAEWLECAEPLQMLEHIRQVGSVRQLRLFGCGCMRLLDVLSWELEKAVEYTEKGEDSLLPRHEVAARIRRLAFQMNVRDTTEPPWILIEVPIEAARRAAWYFRSKQPKDDVRLISLMRDIFGDYSHPITLNPSWITSTVVALSQGIYQEKAFDRMPVLADALQDAGCDNEDILKHCRQPNEHVRGCWLLDLLTGRQDGFGAIT